MRKTVLRAAPVVLGAALVPLPSSAAPLLAFFGSHLTGPDVGFSLGQFDAATGVLAPPHFLQESEAPSFFVIHPDAKHLYTCNSVDAYLGKPEGSVSAYALEPGTGKLTPLNRKPTGGANPCYVSLDRTGHFLLAANYNGGSICVYALQPDGRLGERTAFVQHSGHGPNPQRQSSPHPHFIITDPDNRFALVCDLGLDKIFLYRFDPTNGSLAPHDPASVPIEPGSGPRHLAFHLGGKYVYLLNEMSNTVTAFAWKAAPGSLAEFQTISTLPPGYKAPSTAGEIAVHPNGKFLYASNRGHDSIAVFAINPGTGRLSAVEHVPTRGRTPRYFTLDPTGKWLVACNHDSDNAAVFRVDGDTGRLAQAGEPIAVPNPFCLRFLEPAAGPVQ